MLSSLTKQKPHLLQRLRESVFGRHRSSILNQDYFDSFNRPDRITRAIDLPRRREM